MTLPSTGIITAAMINEELGRAANAPLNLNDSAVRALAGKPSGAISFADLRGKSSEIVVNLTNNGIDLMSSLFTAADWASATTKRVIVPAGTEFGHPTRNYAIAVAATANGQANSFGGRLILENRGVISGCRGAANSGTGGTAVFANLLGRNGQKMEIINSGTIRGGGGGGGRGGNGGYGGGGVWWNQYWVYDPGDGSWRFDFTSGKGTYWAISVENSVNIMWDRIIIATGGPAAATEWAPGDGWTYEKGAKSGSSLRNSFYIRRRRLQTDPVYTGGGAGGAGGNGGIGQGYGQGNTGGAGGAAGAPGGTNAGAGGYGGTGGAGGGYGAAGAAGAWGNTGAAGNNGGGAGGAAGAGGGAAGCYIDGASRVTWASTGTLQGRAIN